MALAVVGLSTAVAFGLLRGAAVEVWRDAEGTVWARGSRPLLALWVASSAARIGLLAAGSWLGAGGSTAETLVFAAATLAAQNAAIWLKSGASAGAPALRRA